MDMANLSKLTVSQLRGLCKEKGLSNYWKISKAALLAKLEGAGVVSDINGTSSTSSKPAKESQGGIGTTAGCISKWESTPSLCTAEPIQSHVGLSTGPKTPCSGIQIPDLYQTPDAPIPKNIPTLASSKRSSEIASLASPSAVNPTASKRRKISSRPGHLTDFKVPGIPVRNNQLSPAIKDLGICTSQHQSVIQLSNSILVSLPSSSHLELPGQNAEKLPEATKIAPAVDLTAVHPPLEVSPKTCNISAISPQRNESGVNNSFCQDRIVTGSGLSTPLSLVSSVLTAPNPPSRLKIGLSRNINTSRSRGSSTMAGSAVNKPPFRPETPIINVPRPSSNQSQMHIPYPQPSSRHSPVSMCESMETSILSNLKPISLPPSISQRKRLSLLSLALCCLNDEARMTCILVSKLFRYAVYLSAQDILTQRFSGKRFSRLIRSLPSKNLNLGMTNLWPYLRLRQEEVDRRKKEFAKGWVAEYFREFASQYTLPMTEKLWVSPDCEEQFVVVQRFIQTRLCFALSFHGMGDASDRWVSSVVVDAQEVLANEIWSITVAEPRSENGTGNQEKTYYVLYQTCEVIGHPPSDPFTGSSAPSDQNIMQTDSCCIPLRADWSVYIALRLPSTTRHLYAPLLKHVRGTNTDDFEGGVAKSWLKRVRSQGKEGNEKLVVAEKYILGCVVGNSVSGAYRSITRMALEFAGINDIPCNEQKGEKHLKQEVNLFLPERHNVESVHFTGPRGPLHPALAVVQTAGRQDGTIVLRENGISIGEDEQVPEVWMRLLGCTVDGMKEG